MSPDVRQTLIGVTYFVSAILFIFGLKRLSSPRTARSGNRIAAVGMALALVVTLFDAQIVSFGEIAVGTVIGAAIGIYWGRVVKMTAMPQMVAIFNGMGGATAALVSLAEYTRLSAGAVAGVAAGTGEVVSIALGTAIGAVSAAGSVIAFLKLQGWMSDRWRLRRATELNAALLLAIVVVGLLVVLGRTGGAGVWVLFALALLLGLSAVLPIGGADMPVVISLLNSFTGMAAALTGFVVDNQILIVAGALVGASGTFLTLLMSRAMNRPLSNVLFSGFGGTPVAGGAEGGAAAQRVVRSTDAEDVAVALAYAHNVIVVPGYGLAVAQAQHTVRELSEELEKRGVNVRYAIHPVAGRMPGHMNVLLAEANIPYEQLAEMEQINGDFDHTDVVLVIGANDVVNPAARSDPASPIYGMPILDVDRARNVVVLKRSMRPGFAGIDNELFYRDHTQMLFGDAKASLAKLVEAVRGV